MKLIDFFLLAGFGSQFASDNSFASAFSNAKSTNGECSVHFFCLCARVVAVPEWSDQRLLIAID